MKIYYIFLTFITINFLTYLNQFKIDFQFILKTSNEIIIANYNTSVTVRYPLLLFPTGSIKSSTLRASN